MIQGGLRLLSCDYSNFGFSLDMLLAIDCNMKQNLASQFDIRNHRLIFYVCEYQSYHEIMNIGVRNEFVRPDTSSLLIQVLN